jgi:hypothetical protein
MPERSTIALSGKASDIVRQLGFAGIALVWIFKTDQAGRFLVPSDLFLPATLIVVGLSLDLLQYILGTAAWGIYNSVKERSGTIQTDEFLAPRWINWPALVCFWGKIIVMGVAYVFLIRFLAHRVV